MLYELTTGRLPFTGDEPVTVISQHLYAAPVQPRAHRPEIPPTLEAVTLSLLAKDPDDRPGSAAEVALRLEHWDDDAVADDAALSLLDRMVRGRMVGRERELAEVSALWRRALAGAGQALLISGEPGIGKTRLVRELSALAEVSGAVVLRGECYAEGGSPNAPIVEPGKPVRLAHLNFGIVNHAYGRYYLANSVDHTVTIVDTDTDTVAGTVPVGTKPIQIQTDLNGGNVYVVNQGSHSVSVLDATTEAVLTSYAVGTGPWRNPVSYTHLTLPTNREV